ncbi:hypothetical protein ACFVGY_18575 [Streptomyces sp. NPDC127106]|uniref:hypothetical protein n=1 Tax=Streptomyces sp. NPDC127106 TaxID=3345360 RepID=UPI0036338FEC
MKSYAVQVHRYGSVAVVTLCARTDRADTAACLERLAHVLTGIGAEVGSVVLDLDCAPYPAPVDALDAVDAWAAGREITVVALTPSYRRTGTRRPSAPSLRAVPAGLAEGAALGPPGGEAAPARQLRRVLGVRALVHQAAGIRQGRHRSHPCS